MYYIYILDKIFTILIGLERNLKIVQILIVYSN